MVSRDNCAIPPLKKARKRFAILSLQVSRDMKSIAAGPLSALLPRGCASAAQSMFNPPHVKHVQEEQTLPEETRPLGGGGMPMGHGGA